MEHWTFLPSDRIGKRPIVPDTPTQLNHRFSPTQNAPSYRVLTPAPIADLFHSPRKRKLSVNPARKRI